MDARQSDVHDEVVEHDHEQPDGDDHERPDSGGRLGGGWHELLLYKELSEH